MLEHFLYDVAGEWAVATSDGEYALVGARDEFVKQLKQAFDYNAAETVRTFVSDWTRMGQAGADVSWLPTLLHHVFGEDLEAFL
jgi:uncharacterized heparinase superfamily protein